MFNKIIDYIKNAYLELKKVSWPTKSGIVNSTIVVFIISAIVALIIFVLDRIFTALLGIVIR